MEGSPNYHPFLGLSFSFSIINQPASYWGTPFMEPQIRSDQIFGDHIEHLPAGLLQFLGIFPKPWHFCGDQTFVDTLWFMLTKVDVILDDKNHLQIHHIASRCFPTETKLITHLEIPHVFLMETWYVYTPGHFPWIIHKSSINPSYIIHKSSRHPS